MPASCGQVEAAVRDATAGLSTGQAARVEQAVAAAGQQATNRGFQDAAELTLVAELGLLAVAFLTAFALPHRARPAGDGT